MNILLILPPLMEDVVCSTALIRCVKKSVAGVVLHVLVPAPFAYLIAKNPHIDKVLPAQSLHTQLGSTACDALIDVPALEENRRWAKVRGARYLLPEQPSWRGRLRQLLAAAPTKHRALQLLAAASSLGVAYDGRGMEIHLPENVKVSPQDIPLSHSAGYVLLHLGNEMPLHLAMLEQWCRQSIFPIMLAGSPVMAGVAERLAKTDPIKVYNAVSKFSEAETADLVRCAKIFVSADGAALQLAAASGRPAIVVRSPKQPPHLVPPIYAAHLAQAAKQPFSVFEAGKNKRAHLSAPGKQDSADRLATIISEMW